MPRRSRKPSKRSRAPMRRRRRQYTKRSTLRNVQTLNTQHGKNLVVRKFPGLFPDVALTAHRYTDKLTITSTSGALGSHSWRDSLYDPDYTGTGAQPLGFDQFATLYEKYNVQGLAYEFTILGDSTNPVRVCTAIQEDNTGWANFETAVQQPNSSKGIVILPGSKMRLKGYLMPHKILGVSKAQYNTDIGYNHVSTSANPTKPIFLQLLVQSVDESSTSTVTVVSSFKLYARWSDKIELSSS